MARNKYERMEDHKAFFCEKNREVAEYSLIDTIGLYILSQKSVSKTKLIKLMFLIDLTIFEKIGKPLFNIVWKKELLGPFSPEIMKNIKKNLYINSDYNLLTLKHKKINFFIDKLYKDIIDECLNKWIKKSFEDTINYIYDLPNYEDIKNASIIRFSLLTSLED